MNAALKKSYDLERKGLEFYIESAANCNNALARRTLFSLAQEEIKHMMKIDDISLAIEGNGRWPDHGADGTESDIEALIRSFFENTGKEIIGEGRDNADVIKKAMELERQSFELYTDLQKKASDGAEKSFYGELVRQEKEHYAALENVYYYLTRTGDWFEKEESNVWSWMNS